jgi:chromosome segregation ATPase
MNPSTLATISVCIATLTLLFGGGALLNTFRAGKDHAANVAVYKYRLDEATKKIDEHSTQLAQMKSTQSLMDQRLEQIKEVLKKLDLLETVNQQMHVLMSRTESIMPRPEADAKFTDLTRRVDTVEEAVHELEQTH